MRYLLTRSSLGTKFDVKYNSREDILARMSSAPEKFMENFFMEGYLATIDGDSDAIRPNNLNKLVDVKPMGVREYLEKWWGN